MIPNNAMFEQVVWDGKTCIQTERIDKNGNRIKCLMVKVPIVP